MEKLNNFNRSSKRRPAPKKILNLCTMAALSLSAIAAVPLIPSLAQAGFYRHEAYYGGRPFHIANLGLWRSGRWYHGAYGGHIGWWWIVGGVWHFYPQPYYPYPDPNMAPVYIVEVPATAAPVPAQPATVVQVVAPTQTAPTAVSQSQPAAPIAPMPAPAAPIPAPQELVATAPKPPPAAQSFYCTNPVGYYPTIQNCPGGWIATPVAPPK